MSVQVKIPAVGESISSGVVSVWHKKTGEQVKKGEPLFTLETDKVSTEIVAETDGVHRTKGDALAATQNRAPAERTDTKARTATDVAGPVDSLAPAAQDDRVVRKKMSPLRRKIAQQLVMAQHTAAILTTFNECDMSEVQA